ncbi:hypothetical protein CLIB1444_03S07580 [[Candida] jaroonii]|uniref:Uncharacterized protein n=1 Tax=[Candida] jaroonii TaxID=467808 RepID=A0ACA9Y5F0_9ASCO|nr:hypothetical protein CLIB1444_03S07580 [[Candida] jaroonii]
MELDASILSDSDKLASFINADQHIRIISRWKYYGKTNNHGEFSKLTKNLYEISNHLHQFPKDKSLPFFKDLLEQSNLKLIYRCLNHQKNQLTINVIKLLNNLINNGYLTLFINNFNLELNFLFKLVLKTDNIRKEFIKFYINLLSVMSYVDRKFQLSSNTKVWLNIFKLLANDDEDILDLVMNFIDEKILNESNYSKVTKMTFLNEGTLFNLQKIHKKDTFSLFEKIVDDKIGILFKEPPNTTISVNNVSFKINNKILYKLLTFLKIDSIEKVNLSVLILSKDHNLIDPFMNYLTLNNGNDLVSSITYNLLFVRVLNFPTSKVSEIYLKTFNKSSLVKNLNHDNDFIKYLVMTVIHLICDKFEVLKPIEINKILSNLPNINDILNTTTSNQVMSLMKVKLLEKLSKYELNNALIKYLNNELTDLVDLKGINLQLFNYYIRIFINSNTNFEIKNVNHLPKMIKFSNLNVYKNNWILYNLINRLFTLPRDNLINPFFSLIFIHFPEQLNNLLVELFQRLNSPYKYYDMPFNLHIVIKILIEQYSIFRKKSGDVHDSWFNDIVNNFFVIGEDWNELERYCKTFDLVIKKQSVSPIQETKFIGDDYQLMYSIRKFQQSKKPEIYAKILDFITDEHINNLNVFKLLVEGDIELLSVKMKGLKIKNQDIMDFVFQQMKHGKLYHLNWLLTEEQLNYQFDEDIRLHNFKLLLTQGKIPDISIEELFSFKNKDKLIILKEKLTTDNLIDYVERVCKEKSYELLAMELSDEVVEYLIQNVHEPQLSIVASFIRSSNSKLSELFQKVKIIKCPNYLNLVNNVIKFTGSLDPETVRDIHENFELSVDLIYFLQKYPNSNVINQIFINITKFFAEDLIPENFDSILNELTKIFPVAVDLNILNTQLEVFLNSKYVDNYDYLNYINKVVLSYKVDYYKLLMIFLNNKDIGLKFTNEPSIRIETSFIIYNLFFAEGNLTAERANNILNLVLGVYSGSIRFEDLILKEVLKSIETTNNINWINVVKINNWEINNFNTKDFELIGDQKLIDNGLISINKKFIKNLQHFKYGNELAKTFRSVTTSNLKSNYRSMINFINTNVFKINYNYSETVYDYEFLMLLILNNEEFFSFDNDKITVNITNLIDYNILEILIQNYNEPLSKIVVKSLVTNFPEEFKDGNVFKIYLCNLINTYRSHKLSPIQLRLYSSFVPILANPGNFLYEITYKYVLGHPIIKEVELPNFNDIKFENLKMVDWYLDLFVNFIDVDDLRVLNKNNFFEWILNLLNMALPASVRRKIEKIVFHLLEIFDGSNTLVTKYGFLTFLNQVKMNPQIAVKLEMTKSKRLMEWSDNDFPHQLKRIKVDQV